MSEKVKINNVEYTVSPLNCGQLRELSVILKERVTSKRVVGIFEDIDVFFPFITSSICVKHPEFKKEILDLLTLVEFNETWAAVTRASGVNFVKGEQKPPESTGTSSTVESASPSAGPSVM